jgi:hypothetical protein
MMQRGDIYLYLEGEKIIKKPNTIIGQKNKTQPAVDLDRPLKRHQLKIIRIPDLCSCYDQDDKTECVHPVPDSDR